MTEDPRRTWTRRQVLGWGLGGLGALAAAGATGVELVLHDVLPGHQALNELDGACSVAKPSLTFAPVGPAKSGQFASSARRRSVGYTIAYPPDHPIGSPLPLIVALHGYGNDHTNVLTDLSLQQALAMRVAGRALPPMAMVAADGGGGYWHAQPGDDPLGMLLDELIPMCQALGLGVPPHGIGAIGISMGAYGALLLAERRPDMIPAVAAISPAIWTTYGQASSANRGAFASAEDFSANDVIHNAPALAHSHVRVSSGRSDPFHPGVKALVRALPATAVVNISNGCHTGPFFAAAQPPSLAFLADHLGSTAAT